MKKEMILEENLKTHFSFIWRLISAALKHKTTSRELEENQMLYNCWLHYSTMLLILQKIQAQVLQEAIICFDLVCQGKTDSCQIYMDRFDDGMRVKNHFGGKLPIYPDTDQKEKVQETTRGKLMRKYMLARNVQVTTIGNGSLPCVRQDDWETYLRPGEPAYSGQEIFSSKTVGCIHTIKK